MFLDRKQNITPMYEPIAIKDIVYFALSLGGVVDFHGHRM